MFTTVIETKELTTYDVDEDLLYQAQAIVESYVGRVEVEVTSATDLMLLGRATAYQAAYMKNDPAKIYEQISASQISQFGASITFKPGDESSPWVAPLAKIACQRLSWKRMRSVRTGSIYGPRLPEPRWVND